MNAEKLSKCENTDDVVAGAPKEYERVSELYGFAGSLLKRRLTWLNLSFTWLFSLTLKSRIKRNVGCKMSFF